MNGRETLILELIDVLDNMLDIIEEQEIVEPEFATVRGTADQLREELTNLQE